MTQLLLHERAGTSFPSYRAAHEASSILVCGCGESLRDLVGTTPMTTIGVNDVGRLFDPTYRVVVNPRNQFKGDRFRYVEQSRSSVLFTHLDLGAVRPPTVRFTMGAYGGTEVGDAKVLHYTQNSPYVADCLAAYMGARRIGLLGVDFTDHHFFARNGPSSPDRAARADRSRVRPTRRGAEPQGRGAGQPEYDQPSAAATVVRGESTSMEVLSTLEP